MKFEFISKLLKKASSFNWLMILFWVVFLLSLWSVLAWGFGLIPLINYPVSGSIITGTLALSYSYLAGCIFYFLTTLLPKQQKKRSRMRYLISEIHELGTEFANTLELFKVGKTGGIIVNLEKVDDCYELLISQKWDNVLNYPSYKGGNTFYHWFYSQFKKITLLSINILATYKEILSEKQIENLYRINEKYVNQLLELIDSVGMPSDPVIKTLSGRFCEMLNEYNKLNHSLIKKYRRSPSYADDYGRQQEKPQIDVPTSE